MATHIIKPLIGLQTQFLMSGFFFWNRRKKIGNVSRPHSFPRPLSAGGKSAEAKRKILFPRKKDFRFAESVLKPHHLLEELEAESRKKMFSSFFRRKN